MIIGHAFTSSIIVAVLVAETCGTSLISVCCDGLVVHTPVPAVFAYRSSVITASTDYVPHAISSSTAPPAFYDRIYADALWSASGSNINEADFLSTKLRVRRHKHQMSTT